MRRGRSLGFRGQSCFDIEFFQHPGKAYLWGERMESVLAVVAGNDVELFIKEFVEQNNYEITIVGHTDSIGSNEIGRAHV